MYFSHVLSHIIYHFQVFMMNSISLLIEIRDNFIEITQGPYHMKINFDAFDKVKSFHV